MFIRRRGLRRIGSLSSKRVRRESLHECLSLSLAHPADGAVEARENLQAGPRGVSSTLSAAASSPLRNTSLAANRLGMSAGESL
jgi:hypothetical protein